PDTPPLHAHSTLFLHHALPILDFDESFGSITGYGHSPGPEPELSSLPFIVMSSADVSMILAGSAMVMVFPSTVQSNLLASGTWHSPPSNSTRWPTLRRAAAGGAPSRTPHLMPSSSSVKAPGRPVNGDHG